MILLVYLIGHGCYWEAVNFSGKNAADILRENGYPKEVIKVLDRMATDVLKWTDDGSEQGYILERFGDKYIWIGRMERLDTAVTKWQLLPDIARDFLEGSQLMGSL